MSGGELCLLQHEVDQIELMTETMLKNDVCKGLIEANNTEYEVPGVGQVGRFTWKGKACLLYTSPSPRDRTRSRMPSSA